MTDASEPKVALITGVGRRRSTGAALALGLARDGLDLALNYWTPYDDRVGLERSAVDTTNFVRFLLSPAGTCNNEQILPSYSGFKVGQVYSNQQSSIAQQAGDQLRWTDPLSGDCYAFKFAIA